MRAFLWPICMLVGLGAVDAAPAQTRMNAAALRSELEQKQRRLAEVASLEERLLELRIRHELGLPVRGGNYFGLTADDRDHAEVGGRDRQEREEAETRRLSERVADLQVQLDSAREMARTRPPALAALGQPATAPPWSEPTMTEPLVGPGLTTEPSARTPTDPAPIPTPEPTPAAPLADVATTPQRMVPAPRDAATAGRLLLLAGEARLREASRIAGDDATAAALRDKGRALLTEARQTLDPLVAPATARPVDMFLMARCLEQLGEIEKADSMYARIMSRDFVEGADGTKEFGPWGLAAQAAKSTMAWLADTGGWRPVRDVDAIRWDGK
jgi:hypothetical protein